MNKRTADRMRVLFIHCGVRCESPWAVARPLGNGRFSATFDARGAVEAYGAEFHSWRYGFRSVLPFPYPVILPAGDSLTINRKFTITAVNIQE